MTKFKMTAKELMLMQVEDIFDRACEDGDNQALCIACILTKHNLHTKGVRYAKKMIREMATKWQGNGKMLEPLEIRLLKLAY